MKKTLFFIFSLSILGYFIFANSESSLKSSIDEARENKPDKIKIVACPTSFEIANKLDKKIYQVIETASTAESVNLFQDKQADIILAGRTLKPGEPNLKTIVIGEEGYSFLSTNEKMIYADELSGYEFYTDFDIELLKARFSIQKIHKVDDVYKYLSEGIVITSWENTDYEKANVVHVYERNGERNRLSRQVAIYYPKNIEEKAKEISLILKK